MSCPRLSVEFVGIPGAGKSAVSRRVVALLRGRGLVVDDLSYRLAHEESRATRFLRKSVYVTKEIVLHPIVTTRSLVQIAAVPHPSLRILAKMAYNWLLVSALARRGREPGIHICDQGIFQGFWSMGFGGGSAAVAEAARRLWGLVPAPDLVVVIEADLPAIRHRLKLRQERKSRLDRLFESHPSALERCARLLDDTIRVLEEIRARDASVGVVVLRCEKDGDLDKESHRLLTLIESLLAGRATKETALAAGRP